MSKSRCSGQVSLHGGRAGKIYEGPAQGTGGLKHLMLSPGIYESIVSLVSRRYKRVVNGSLVACLSEYLGLPVVCEVNGVVSMKPIDMYILHDSSVGVCFPPFSPFHAYSNRKTKCQN